MKTATVTQAKNGLSALLDQVRGGETILITDRGMPVARLEPVAGPGDADARMQRLARAGVVRLPKRRVDLDKLLKPGPKLPEGVSLVDTVIEERRTGR